MCQGSTKQHYKVQGYMWSYTGAHFLYLPNIGLPLPRPKPDTNITRQKVSNSVKVIFCSVFLGDEIFAIK